uniref:Uncharacterized protein n=1 Tax=Oryza punctata TaxID=4537 RepID=A0A0E0KPK5_ORYPU
MCHLPRRVLMNWNREGDFIKIHANQVTLSLDLILQSGTANGAQFNTPCLHPRYILRLTIIAPATKIQNLTHLHFPIFSCSSSMILSSPSSIALVSFPIPACHPCTSRTPYSKDLTLVVDAPPSAAVMTVTELVVERCSFRASN